MKKLLVLLLVAACVGLVISKTRESRPQEQEGATGERSGAPAAASEDTGRAPRPARAPAPPRSDEPEEGPALAGPPPSEAQLIAALAGPGERPAPDPQEEGSPTSTAMALSAVTGGHATASGATAAAKAAPQSGAQAVMAALDRAAVLMEADRLVEARAELTGTYLATRGDMVVPVRDMLDRINAELVFNPRCTQGATIHTVQAGESLWQIGKDYGVSWRMLKRLNGMESDRIRIGQKLKIITGRFGVVAVKSEFRMALMHDGAYVKEYPIGIGKNDKTPEGTFTIKSLDVRPAWTTPEGKVIKYGEEGYRLGERWIAFADVPGATGIGIHGTHDEASIGTKCSNGCIRMRNVDVIELFDFMTVGSSAEVKE